MLDIIINKWQDILFFIKDQFEITDISFNTWLTPTRPYLLDEERLYIIVSEDNNLFKNYITKYYKDHISIAVQAVAGIKVEPVFILSNEADSIGKNDADIESPDTNDFNDLIRRNGLNPKYTFYSFVPGKSNELAHAASIAVAENPGKDYKLLYLYGGVGLGKTHLMHAIAIYILKNNPKARILYVTSENFMNEYINSIKDKSNTPEKFRNKYRNLDVLLIDDIQFIAGREGTQEEFFNTFNTLYDNDKQIIISSDKPPRDINNLEERIKSRFEGGMMVDIQPPNFETRMAILRKKEEIEGYNIDDEVIKYIATNIKSNIRTLEGALSRIVLKSKLEKVPVNVDTAAVILKDVIGTGIGPERILPKKIISVVSEHYQVSEEDVISPKKNRELAYPRQIIMYLCCEMTSSTQKEIGEALGRDHATIIHGRNKIAAEIKNDEKLKADIEILKKKITP
ncbi:MAG: chromosomal replication initiator protein DnaA [Clostridiales bacterium]|nr:chromosomal replication initiator protein DnaA [Clostridiales bacterium]MDO5140203.1 chromosomal replication initiator protein DnaA [Eubacteriales bacterium]